MSQQDDLAIWWAYRQDQLSQSWNLGLDRVAAVAKTGSIAPEVPVITVAGTNGKGSVCAFMEAMAVQAGIRVGVYSSPHLLRFNERIRLNGMPITDRSLARAFAQVADLDGVKTLSVYEFDTLAAMAAFNVQPLDLVILEVGLGGRLDAVNIWDPDVAVITVIDLDHQQWLGDNREAIGAEKAGIIRPRKPLVLGDRDAPSSILQRAQALGAPTQTIGVDFDGIEGDQGWLWKGPVNEKIALPALPLRGRFQLDNASVAIAAMRQLFNEERLSPRHVGKGLALARLPGRAQRLNAEVPIWLDVGHNPQAAGQLLNIMATEPVAGRTLAVFAALVDKQIESIVAIMREAVDFWFLPALDDPRACALPELYERVVAGGVLAPKVLTCDNVALAIEMARAEARAGDQIVVFGSFLTVADAMRVLLDSGQ